jgi:hypothetical protein
MVAGSTPADEIFLQKTWSFMFTIAFLALLPFWHYCLFGTIAFGTIAFFG